MDKKRFFNVAILIFSIFFLTLACGSSNEGTLVTQESQAPAADEDGSESAPEESVPEDSQSGFDVYQLGNAINVEDHIIRLNSVEYQGNVLVVNFLIENQGTTDVNVSSLLSFSAKKSDGTLLEQEIFDCGTSSIDGSVLPGDKLRGDICWSGANPEDGIRIYYEASLFGSGAVVWEAVEGEVEPSALDTDASATITTYAVGDIIEVQDHTVRLNSIAYQGLVLMANFTIENHGASDVGTSSMIAFDARKGDGSSLQQEFFDCGTSSLDGSVLPGDRLRGNVCWSGASPDDGIKIYYEASLLGDGALVWEAIEGAIVVNESNDPVLNIDMFNIGDVVEVDDQTITLNSVAFTGNVLQANFTIANLGSTDVNVSSMLSFNARQRDGSNLEQEFFSCGTSMDGTIIPGDLLRGDVCWKGANPDNGIRIYYEADVFEQGAVVWPIE